MKSNIIITIMSGCLEYKQDGYQEAYDRVFNRIETSTNIADAKDCDLIIEVKNLELPNSPSPI